MRSAVRLVALCLAGALCLVACGDSETVNEPDPTSASAEPGSSATSEDDPAAPAASGWDGVTDPDPGTVTLAGAVFAMETVTHCQETFELDGRSGVLHKIEANGEGLQINFDFQTPTDDVGVPLLLVSITPSDDPQVIVDVIGKSGVFAPEGLPIGVPSGGRVTGESMQDEISFSWDVGVPDVTPVDDTPGFEC